MSRKNQRRQAHVPAPTNTGGSLPPLPSQTVAAAEIARVVADDTASGTEVSGELEESAVRTEHSDEQIQSAISTLFGAESPDALRYTALVTGLRSVTAETIRDALRVVGYTSAAAHGAKTSAPATSSAAPARAWVGSAIVGGIKTPNPKRANSEAWALHNLYQDGERVSDYIERAKAEGFDQKRITANLRWDVEKGHITLREPGAGTEPMPEAPTEPAPEPTAEAVPEPTAEAESSEPALAEDSPAAETESETEPKDDLEE